MYNYKLFEPKNNDCLMNWSDFCLNSSDVTGVPGVHSGLRTTYSTQTFA